MFLPRWIELEGTQGTYSAALRTLNKMEFSQLVVEVAQRRKQPLVREFQSLNPITCSLYRRRFY